MRFRLQCCLLLLFAVTLFVIAACQGPPPTVFVLVVTATSEVPTAEISPGAVVDQDVTPDVTDEPSPTATVQVTPTVDPFPTITANQVQVAEQRFQNGRMFWLQPTTQIWVMVNDRNDPTSGKWTVYNDNFREGETETDSTIVAPAGYFQPVRGFGKLWRQNPEIRRALGWALEDEIGHIARYEYHPGGTVDGQNQYVKAPGYHIVFSAWGDAYRFNEDDGTWVIDQ